MNHRKLLYISMLGESSLYHLEDFRQLCPSGLEKDWIPAWHGDLASCYHFEMVSVDVVRGDALPSPGQIGSVILGGTIHLVFENKAWLKTVLRWLRDYRKLHRPLLGICGGHQMIAVNLFEGNQLIERENGPLFGSFEIELTEAGKSASLFQGLTDRLCFHFANSYHIIPSPQADMTILATTKDSPAVVVDYGHHWYGSQFHPESRRETWECFFKQESGVDLSRYESDSAVGGPELLENFLKICQSV